MECSDYKIIKPMHLKCIDSLLTVDVTQFELTKTPYKMLKKGETIDKKDIRKVLTKLLKK